ncbi:MORC family CW-type zinc finger protein 1 [Fukomys damarensis]|uniref:MORC family CW-type zinc finger protein 1 n=1 Tax=Fukomys damarensis TaxID=885580 RepID=UPI00053F42F7|nr:MORC family CW-type zinc finger protein 1 [Fukomys damarensis]
MADKYASLQRAWLHLDFLHANSTTHGFLFGALAELLDNARDSGAARLDVFSVDNEKLQGGFTLCFLDDGCGISPEEASDIIHFGTPKKQLPTSKFIGQYGNGLKSGSMRIGKDFILFTKKEETMTCVLFSRSFCEEEGLSEVVVPMPSWLTRTRESVTDDPQKFSTELSIIYKYSPFQNEAELMDQFDMICGKCGTLLVIYNLKLLLSGEPELDVKTKKEDILMAGDPEGFPETWSFRAYASVLYFDPCMRIFIQAKKVQTKHLCYCLYRPRKYLYATSSFKGTLKNEVKKAQEAMKIAELLLKEAQIKVNQPDRTASSSAQNILEKALEDVEAKHKNLKEKQRELKKARTLSLFFGVNIENPRQYGMFLYSNSRLIKMHEKVGPQLKWKSLLGTGVIGIVNIPLEIMEPSHNKQEFLNTQEYNQLRKVMGQYLVQYCKDTGISNRNLTLFWNEFRYQNNKNAEKSLDSIQYQRRQAMAIPFIIQCDLCLKWRVLPSSTNYQKEEFLDTWICANNPNHLESSCHDAERLPNIPLGTLNMVLPSRSEKEKQLRESIQRYQNKLVEQQAQLQLIPTGRITEFISTCSVSECKENPQTRKIRPPSGDNLRHASLSSFELSLSQGSQKRNADGADSDVEFISETKIIKKSMQKKMKLQEQRTAAAFPRNVKPAEISQPHMLTHNASRPNVLTPSRSTSPCTGVELPSHPCLAAAQSVRNLLKVTEAFWLLLVKQHLTLVGVFVTSMQIVNLKKKSPSIGRCDDAFKEMIAVLDKNDAVSLKKEKKEAPLINKAKQKLYNGTSATRRSSSLPNLKSLPSVPMEGVSSGREARVCVSGSGKIASVPTLSSQSTSVKETERKLISNLREILLYFAPKYLMSSEFNCTPVEELIASIELEQCPEQTNKKLKICFDQIQNVYMVQYEKNMKRKLQSITNEADRRGILNEVSLVHCEHKRKLTEDKLNNLRLKLAALLQKLQLGGPAGDLEQIDAYLEGLLEDDRLLFRDALK